MKRQGRIFFRRAQIISTLPVVYFGPDTGGARGRMKATRVDHDKFGLSFKFDATSLSFSRQNKRSLDAGRQLPARQTFNRDLINGARSLFRLLASPTLITGKYRDSPSKETTNRQQSLLRGILVPDICTKRLGNSLNLNFNML